MLNIGRVTKPMGKINGDTSSEESSLILVQSKFYKAISFDEIQDAISKLVNFYKTMSEGNLGILRENVGRRFVTLNSEVGEESKIIFVVYTSAIKGGIRKEKVDKVFKNLLPVDNDKYELRVYYADDIVEEIKEAESRRPTVHSILVEQLHQYTQLEMLE